jgi:hypothetical protein
LALHVLAWLLLIIYCATHIAPASLSLLALAASHCANHRAALFFPVCTLCSTGAAAATALISCACHFCQAADRCIYLMREAPPAFFNYPSAPCRPAEIERLLFACTPIKKIYKTKTFYLFRFNENSLS